MGSQCGGLLRGIQTLHCIMSIQRGGFRYGQLYLGASQSPFGSILLISTSLSIQQGWMMRTICV